MNHQDWTPVVLKKSKQPVKQQPNIVHVKEEDGIPQKVTHFERSFCLKIAQLRNEKKWTRKDLAQQLKMTENDIADIENCKSTVKYNGEFVNKCKRLFGNFTW